MNKTKVVCNTLITAGLVVVIFKAYLWLKLPADLYGEAVTDYVRRISWWWAVGITCAAVIRYLVWQYERATTMTPEAKKKGREYKPSIRPKIWTTF